MRRFLLASLVVLGLGLARPASAATPALVQVKSDAGQGTAGITTWKANLVNPSQAGNLLVACIVAGAATPTITVTDDKFNTWHSTTAVTTANNTTGQLWYAQNVAASTQRVTVGFGSSLTFNQVQVYEFTNVDTSATPTDGQNQASTSGTSIASASFSTTINGDLIVQCAALDGFGTPSAPMSWTAGSGMTAGAYDDTTFMAMQYQVQGSFGTTTPAITSSINSTSALSMTVAFKNATAGGNLTGIRVRNHTLMNHENGTAYGTWSGTSMTYQLPVTGNLIAMAWTGFHTDIFTTVASSPSLTWHSTATPAIDPSGTNNTVWFWWAGDATPGTVYAITVSGFGASPVNVNMENFFDISGADTAANQGTPTFANQSGNDTTLTFGGSPVTVNGPNITPPASNGVILAVAQEDQNTVTATAPGYFVATDVLVYSGNSGDTDEGATVYYNPNTSAVQVTWTYSGYESSVTGIGNYASQAIAFRAVAAAAGGAPLRSLLGVGR